ncbi:hypothetical protein AHAS_Ahas19G0112200 [Arachis hypogaea]
MKPLETYKADLNIDLKKHHTLVTFLDKMAYWTIKSLRFPTNLFFSNIIYEPQTVSLVPKSLPIQWMDGVLAKGEEVQFFHDEFCCPIFVKDLRISKYNCYSMLVDLIRYREFKWPCTV